MNLRPWLYAKLAEAHARPASESMLARRMTEPIIFQVQAFTTFRPQSSAASEGPLPIWAIIGDQSHTIPAMFAPELVSALEDELGMAITGYGTSVWRATSWQFIRGVPIDQRRDGLKKRQTTTTAGTFHPMMCIMIHDAKPQGPMKQSLMGDPTPIHQLVSLKRWLSSIVLDREDKSLFIRHENSVRSSASNRVDLSDDTIVSSGRNVAPYKALKRQDTLEKAHRPKVMAQYQSKSTLDPRWRGLDADGVLNNVCQILADLAYAGS